MRDALCAEAQVGHVDPGVTLSIYAQVMRRADRDELRAEIRGLLGAVGGTISCVKDSEPATSAVSGIG